MPRHPYRRSRRLVLSHSPGTESLRLPRRPVDRRPSRRRTRIYTKAERTIDLWLHVIGIGAAAVGVAVLAATIPPTASEREAVSLAVYAGGLLGMLVLSALYHHFVRRPSLKDLFRRLDNAAIFAMIAGTYTPFALVKIGRFDGIALLVFVWVTALIGVVLKLTTRGKADTLAIVLYMVTGWCILPILDRLFASVTLPVSILVVIGGIIYTTGVPFHLWTRLRFHNVIWHACVVVAAACHYAAIYLAFSS